MNKGCDTIIPIRPRSPNSLDLPVVTGAEIYWFWEGRSTHARSKEADRKGSNKQQEVEIRQTP